MIKDARKEAAMQTSETGRIVDVNAYPNQTVNKEGITVNIHMKPEDFRKDVLQNNSPKAAIRKLAPDLE